jgi:hypothetical protein
MIRIFSVVDFCEMTPVVREGDAPAKPPDAPKPIIASLHKKDDDFGIALQLQPKRHHKFLKKHKSLTFFAHPFHKNGLLIE